MASEVTLGVFLVDHRVAFLALVTLYVTAAIPLAFAWARVLPEEKPPFEIKPPVHSDVEPKVSVERSLQRR